MDGSEMGRASPEQQSPRYRVLRLPRLTSGGLSVIGPGIRGHEGQGT